jgi:hypothetical protein
MNRFTAPLLRLARLEALQFALLVSLLSVVASPRASAFPEMARHGYVNCTTCHVSPNGGGLLTSYGRSLSKEIMSTWGRDGEEGLFQGAFKDEDLPEWLRVGGDARVIQTHMETNSVREGRFIWMQADLQTAVRLKALTLVGTIGRIEKRAGPSIESRSYYALYQASEKASVRVGRFLPAFGLNIAEHFLSTRRDLGFDQGREMMSAEFAWIGEDWNLFATAAESPGEVAPSLRETALATQAWRSFGERFKLGVSHWLGRSDQARRSVAGVSAILGFTPTFYALADLDHQWKETLATGIETRGLFASGRIGYELVQGLHAIVIGDFAQSDLKSGLSARDSFGPGLVFYPRPHFEFQGVWQKARARSQGTEYADSAYVMAHYYF